MIRTVVISAAGKGTRMKELAKDKPKHMIDVNGKPFLWYLLENLRAAGFDDLIVVVGHLRQHIEEFAETYPHKLTIVNQFAIMGEDKYGTAVPVLAAREAVNGKPFLAVYGDNLYSVRDLNAMNHDDGKCYVGALPHENWQKYGVLIPGENNRLKEIIEKPDHDVGSKLINTGLFAFTQEIFEACEKVKPTPPKDELYLTDAVTELAKQNKVFIQPIQDYWKDFGSPEDVGAVSQFLKERGE
ncbi:nucleotidyltransferase family protein [Candidatus Parcubacteria bacterium]|jgi:NDP-sugar pyrophosphorylase family protein|nr:MAG: nucleotidyltransferase family protein [Candidatus Parcubacteria bacterium]